MGGKDGCNKRYDNRCSGQTAVWFFTALNVGKCFSTVLYDCGYDHCGTGSGNAGSGIHWCSRLAELAVFMDGGWHDAGLFYSLCTALWRKG